MNLTAVIVDKLAPFLDLALVEPTNTCEITAYSVLSAGQGFASLPEIVPGVWIAFNRYEVMGSSFVEIRANGADVPQSPFVIDISFQCKNG